MYNIYFEVASTGFLVVLILYLYVQYPNPSEGNILYRKWVIWVLAGEIMDVVTGRMIDYGDRISPILNILVNTLYFYIVAWSILCFARYIHFFINGSKSGTYMLFCNTIMAAYYIIMTVNIFTGWVFTFNEKGEYLHGSMYFINYILQLVIAFSSMWLLWKHRKQLETRQKLAIWAFAILVIGGFFLQVVLFPKTLLTSYMTSIATMVLLFIIETPDYEKLDHTMKELEEQRELAEVANNAKTTFLANMSHEIRTPMNAILGMDELILRENEDPNTRKYATNIYSAGKTLLSIINDILDLSKIESGKMELVPVDYDMASVLSDIVNMTMPKAKEKGLAYHFTVDPDMPSVLSGDEIRVRQIILNITNNAIKYTDEGSVSIVVMFNRKEDRLIVQVSDTGIGIRKEDMNKLFSSFQRLDETRNRNVEGTGLGLNITRQLAEMMGGGIIVESEYGKGYVFTVDIRQRVVDNTPIGDYNARLEKASLQKEDFKASLVAPCARILIVDDNEMNLDVITGLLQDTRIRTRVALSGRDCIEMLRKDRFDIVFLDQMMPGLSGVQTLELIRKEGLAEGTPIIVLTADAIMGAREGYLKEGFSDYLAKPVSYSEMEALLYKYLDPSLILSEEQLRDREMEKEDLPLVLVIDESSEKLKSFKELFAGRYKGVFVKDEASAEKFLSRHKVEFVVKGSPRISG